MHRKFETLLLFSPDVGSEDRQQVLDDLNRVVNEYSGQVVEVDDWGKRTLAYPVQKHTRGHYVRLVYGALGSVVAELERRIRIADSVLKFMTVKLAEEFQPAEEA
jgi:small subunit ribosomal protein S6